MLCTFKNTNEIKIFLGVISFKGVTVKIDIFESRNIERQVGKQESRIAGKLEFGKWGKNQVGK